MKNHDLLNKVREVLLQFSSNGEKKLQGDPLATRISKRLNVDEFELKDVFQLLKDSKEIHCEAWYKGFPIKLVTVNIKEREYTAEELKWLNTMKRSGLTDLECNNLFGLHSNISDFSDNDQQSIVKGLIRLRKGQKNLSGWSRFNVSAKYLLGSSKLLDSLSWPILRSFGINLDLFTGSPNYVVVAGPRKPEAVILVENPQSFESALELNLECKIVWVVTYGYGLSKASNEFGDQLVSIIENKKKPIILIRSGNPSPLIELLAHERLFFWGDLDPEGLKIFNRLRSKLPTLKLSGLYEPMVNILKDENLKANHHPYLKSTGKVGQSPWNSSDKELNTLISLCGERGVDQEAISNKLITYDLSMLSLSEVKNEKT